MLTNDEQPLAHVCHAFSQADALLDEPGYSQAQSGLALKPQAHAEGEDEGGGRLVHVLNMRKPAHAGAVS